MLRVARIILYVVVSLSVAILVAFGYGRIRLAASIPKRAGAITLKGLSKQVEIYRDKYGIPHIYAKNHKDLMFAVGYVSAQDRLWQMDLARRAATGHLAEILGENALKADLLVRTLGIEQIARRQVTMLSPEGTAALASFSEGVNACIDHLSALPPEFRLLGYQPARWQASDTMAIWRLLSWQLSKNYTSEIVMMKLMLKLGEERTAEFGPTYPAEGPFIISSRLAEDSHWQSSLKEGSRRLDEIIGTPGGSNSWVVGPELTRNRKPILANDPHLSGTRMPCIWYYVHLVGGGYDVIGALVPGIPLPLLGHNRKIGWGVTNMNADVQDLFFERINPDDENQYEYDGNWVDMDTRRERIPFRKKKGGLSFIEKQVRRTIHGPIVNDFAPGVIEAVSMSWTGFEPTPELDALSALCLARNWKEFCSALSKFGCAPQNFVYADVDGNIGYYGAGIIPIRASGNGTVPQKGWTHETAWKGWVPFEEMPHAYNPPAGYIITANNRIVGGKYKHFLSAEWAPRFRYQRIAELIQVTKEFDVGGMAKIQMDTTSLLAKLICETITPALSDLQVGKYREAVDQLKNWDYNNTVESVPATIYHEFLLKFAKNTFTDEMGEDLAKEYLDDYYMWNERFVRLVQKGSRWFDDVRTEKVETRDDIAIRSFMEAVDSLEKKLGPDMSQWQWGSVHKLELRHPLDANRFVKMIFNCGPFPFPGDGETVNRATFDFDSPYLVTMSASIRNIWDFSHLNETLGIYATGQSENPVSPHYHDFCDRWLKGKYVSLIMDREDYLEDSEGDLTLSPERPPRK